ncbi:MAG: Gfo/Idh/MocA family oxidoreductase [Candidatus Omnitrophica bacterium]|nr:Gfo/Idh/MocA family oxidoreductase [Candidatus Omnitrophota bacterium]
MTANPTRRQFIKASGATAATVSLSQIAWSESKNDQITLAILGLNGRGRYLAAQFSPLDGVEIAAIADPDSRLLNERAMEIEVLSGKKPDTVQDFRTLLDRKDIDAVVVATPDHWHALATIWACEASKDVYVEKPASHNLLEGKMMIEAAKRNNRVVQVGTQRRSAPFLAEAKEYIESGKLGDIGMARVWYMSNRPSIGKKNDSPTPEGVDYDLWLGPAPKSPFNENRFHYEWHWNWDYGTGELGNNGIHGLDMVRALLDIDLPNRVTSGGGLRMYDDDRIAPDIQISTWEYPNLSVVWEHRQRGGGTLYGKSFGVALYGSEEILVSGGSDWEVHRGKEVETHKGNNGMGEHVLNFLDCVRTRKTPNASIEQGHLSTSLCHTGNIAYRLRANLEFDPEKQQFTGNDDANALLGRDYRSPYTPPEGLV